MPHVVTNFDAVSTAYSLSKGPTEGVLNFIAENSDFLKELGRWSDQHQFQSFHFRKTCELAGPKDLSTVTSLNNLAIVVREQGKYEEAEVMHREALSVRERVLGKEHRDTLTSMNDLAIVLSVHGKLVEAVEIHRGLLAVTEKVLGKEHPDTLDGHEQPGFGAGRSRQV